MPNRHSRRPISSLAAIALLLGLSWIGTFPYGVSPARADAASAKAVVDMAKSQGVVGEQGDGYLGLVSGTASPSVTAAVAEINAGRAAVYRQAAAQAGVTPTAAGEAAAKQIFSRIPPGQYYKPLGASWMRK